MHEEVLQHVAHQCPDRLGPQARTSRPPLRHRGNARLPEGVEARPQHPQVKVLGCHRLVRGEDFREAVPRLDHVHRAGEDRGSKQNAKGRGSLQLVRLGSRDFSRLFE